MMLSAPHPTGARGLRITARLLRGFETLASHAVPSTTRGLLRVA